MKRVKDTTSLAAMPSPKPSSKTRPPLQLLANLYLSSMEIFVTNETLRQRPWQASACKAFPTFDKFDKFPFLVTHFSNYFLFCFIAYITVPSLACQLSAVCHCLPPEETTTSTFS